MSAGVATYTHVDMVWSYDKRNQYGDICLGMWQGNNSGPVEVRFC